MLLGLITWNSSEGKIFQHYCLVRIEDKRCFLYKEPFQMDGSVDEVAEYWDADSLVEIEIDQSQKNFREEKIKAINLLEDSLREIEDEIRSSKKT